MQWLGSILFYVLTACTESAKGETPLTTTNEVVAPQNQLLKEAELLSALKLPSQIDVLISTAEHQQAYKQLKRMKTDDLDAQQKQIHLFLLGWTAIQSNQIPMVSTEEIAQIQIVPADYIDFTLAKIHELSGDDQKAIEYYSLIPKTSPLAKLSLSNRFNGLKRAKMHDEANAAFEEILAQPDPFKNGAKILLSHAKKRGITSEKSQKHLRRIWTKYPHTTESKEAEKALKRWFRKGKAFAPNEQDRAERAFGLMKLNRYKQIINENNEKSISLTNPTADGCRLAYALGRSLYKKNHVTRAAALLQKMGVACQQLTPKWIASAYYISGKSLERKKAWKAAWNAYLQIPKKAPNHSMADDGYALAGIAAQESGERKKAIELWTKQLEAYPEGDMAAEGAWRLAWNTHLSGDTTKAISIADEMIPKLKMTGDPVHVMALKYWSARWRIYPTLAADKINPNQSALSQGIDQLMTLVNRHPSRFYALLAAQRLYVLDPDLLSKAKRPSWKPKPSGWQLPESELVHPNLIRAKQLAQIGLHKEATEAFSKLSNKSPTHMSIYAFLSKQNNPVLAHNVLHKKLNKYPPDVFKDNHRQILEGAYPNKYFNLVKEVTESYSYDPRIFHALVREESSFNKDIVSWAGARGLSQLMPRTGKAVAKWMGKSVRKKDFFDPKTNLMLGSRYFEHLMKKLNGNPFLSVAGYNAGGGNVNKWLKNNGNIPTDAFIESIPIRETRGYVKRVLGTYQMYRTLRETGPLFPNWSQFNQYARPK